MLETPELIPWYRDFTGEIEVLEKKIITKGVINKYKKEISNYRNSSWNVDRFSKGKFEKMEAEKKLNSLIIRSNKDENSIDFYIIPNEF